jgi:hypothetical protein
MLIVKADFISITEGLKSLGVIVGDDDNLVVDHVVDYLTGNAEVTLIVTDGEFSVNFELPADAVQNLEYLLFVKKEEGVGCIVSVSGITGQPDTKFVKIKKESKMNKIKTIVVNDQEYQDMMSLAAQATENTNAAAVAFSAMMDVMALNAASAAEAVAASNKAAEESAALLAGIEAKAQAAIAAAAVASAAEVAKIAEQVKLMAEAISQQRQAASAAGQPTMADLQDAAEAPLSGQWYAPTTAKAVGVAALVAAAAAGYYGYQHWVAGK